MVFLFNEYYDPKLWRSTYDLYETCYVRKLREIPTYFNKRTRKLLVPFVKLFYYFVKEQGVLIFFIESMLCANVCCTYLYADLMRLKIFKSDIIVLAVCLFASVSTVVEFRRAPIKLIEWF